MQHYIVQPHNGGAPETLVIFLHGFASGGEETAETIRRELAPRLPSAKFICPDASLSENGCRSWFQVGDMLDGPDGAKAAARAAAAAPAINAYIDGVLKAENMPASRVVIAGFSQGASMAFYAALQREAPVRGLFCLSGGGLDRIENPASKPPVLLAAGEYETGNYSGMPQVESALQKLKTLGFTAGDYCVRGQEHALNRETLAAFTFFSGVLDKIAPLQRPVKRPPPPRL